MKRINLRHAVLAAGLVGLALVAGCRNSTPETPIENTEVNLLDTADAMINNAAEAIPAPVSNVAASPSNPGADFTTDSQTFDDADATGMTARLPQDNGTEPAEEKAQ